MEMQDDEGPESSNTKKGRRKRKLSDEPENVKKPSKKKGKAVKNKKNQTTPSKTASKHGTANHICGVCGKHYSHRESLWRHKKIDHEGFKWSCSDCDKEFTHPATLKEHKKNVHEGVRWTCASCDQVFTFRKSLISHVKKQHN